MPERQVMFGGTFDRTIDAKGRLALPPKFRSRLSDGGYVSTMRTCLGLWTPEGFEQMAQRLEELAQEGKLDQAVLRNFFGFAEDVSIDAQGRISLPARLRDSAQLDREAMLIGRNTRVEIFAPGAWQEQEDTAAVASAFEALAL